MAGGTAVRDGTMARRLEGVQILVAAQLDSAENALMNTSRKALFSSQDVAAVAGDPSSPRRMPSGKPG